MSVDVQMRELAERILGMPVAGFSERETEQYLVSPFIDALGFDSRDPDEVPMQFPIRMGSTTKSCDYAIRLHGEVRILIECKKASMPLDDSGQLASYFSQVSTALLGVYTNGIEYRFYSEDNRRRIKRMDSEPFLALDLRNLDQAAMQRLSTCKDKLGDPQGFLEWVDGLRAERALGERLRLELMDSPSDELVGLAMDWVGAKDKTPEQIDHFRGIFSAAVRDILQTSSPGEVQPGSEPTVQPVPTRHATQAQEISLDQAAPFVQPKGRNAPVAMTFRNGTEVAVRNWRHMMEEIAYWLYQGGRLNAGNCEVQSPIRPSRKLLSPNENEFRSGGAPVRNTGIRMDTQYGGPEFVQNACQLLRAFGEDPSEVHLRLRR